MIKAPRTEVSPLCARLPKKEITGKTMTKEERFYVIKELAPIRTPKEIEKEYGINYNSIYHYCDKYGIPKYRQYQAYLKEDFEQEYQGLISDIKAEKKRRVEAYLNGED